MPTSARSTRSRPSKGDALGLRDLTVAEVLGHLPDPLLALGPDWTVLYMNVAAERLLDCRAEDLAGTNIWDAFPEAVESRVEYARAMRDGVTVQFTEFYAPLGRWFSVQAVPHRMGLSVFFHDIDALKAAEQRAARLADVLAAREKVASAIAAEERLSDIFELVCRQSVELLNGSDAWLIRYTEPGYEVVGTTVTDADGLGVGARLTVLPAAGVVPICRAGEVWGALCVGWPESSGATVEADTWLRDLADLVAVAVENARAREELAWHASTDALTDLANLRSLHARLDDRIVRAREDDVPMTFAVFDVDHFKAVNDGLGHEIGDMVLQAVASQLRGACRQQDLAARIGGDEFALVLEDCDIEAALKIVERLRRQICATHDAALPAVTVSVGICAWEHGLDREGMQRRADDALYWAKLHGRNAAWAYDAELMDTLSPDKRAGALRRDGTVVDAAELQEGVRSAKAFWQSTLDALSKHIAVLDESGTIIATNKAWRAFSEANSGDPERTGVGANYLAACDAARDTVPAAVGRGIRELLAGHQDMFELDYPCQVKGHERWFTVRANRFEADRPRRVVVHHEDITVRRSAEQRSAFQGRLLDVVGICVMAIDADLRISYWNNCAESLFGWPAAEVVGRPVLDLGIFAPDAAERVVIEDTLIKDGSWHGQLAASTRAGRQFPAGVTNTVIYDDQGLRDGVIGTVYDLTQINAYQRELTASRDYLHTVTESVADGLLVFNADGLVTYTNTAARTLLSRGTDLVGTPARTAFYADTTTDGTSRLLDPRGRPARAEEDVFRSADGTAIPVAWTAASLSMPSDTAPDALPDDAVGGRVVVFRDITEQSAHEERLRNQAEGQTWATRIREGLQEDRFVLYAQPIVEIATGKIVDHELLIRLRDSDDGLVAPGVFLPAAEAHDLMGDIDVWVTEQAVLHAQAGMAVHCNLSSQSLGSNRLLVILRDALKRTGADPRRLTFEITETAMVDDSVRATNFAQQLRDLGCHVALDDFGSGYNGFARITQLPADVLKIDQQFVRDLLAHDANESVIKAIVALATDLGIKTVGEGVEDAATLQRLGELGVQYAQGYFLGRPQPLPLSR
ncbi:MAG: EAL domain-containing protein [Baekduia sp.]